MEVINSLKDQVKELAVKIKEINNKVDCNAVTTRSGLATKELVRKDMEVDNRVKEDIHEEDVIIEEIAREPIKTKSELTREAKQAITREKLYPHKPTKQDKVSPFLSPMPWT